MSLFFSDFIHTRTDLKQKISVESITSWETDHFT